VPGPTARLHEKFANLTRRWGNGERVQLAGSDVFERGGNRAEGGLHLAAEQVGHTSPPPTRAEVREALAKVYKYINEQIVDHVLARLFAQTQKDIAAAVADARKEFRADAREHRNDLADEVRGLKTATLANERTALYNAGISLSYRPPTKAN
jgi:hypothetical protein